MTQQYGLTLTGFVPKPQSVIISEIQTALQTAIGTSINLLPQSVFGQLVGVFSEREALVWQLGEAVYASQYPAGAEGTSVDNILSLNGLRRLAATPTKTAPTNTSGTPGLVLYGTPATVIPAGSIITVSGSPSTQFTLDSAVTISSAVNAQQSISLFGGTPTQGTFVLGIIDPAGNTLLTDPLAWNINANTTQVNWSIAPSLGTYVYALGNQVTLPLNYNATAAQVQTAVQSLTGYSGVTVTGSIGSGGFLFNWGTVSQPLLAANATKLAFSADPTAGSIQISIGGNSVASIAYNGTAAQLQANIRTALSSFGYQDVVVIGTPTMATGFTVIWFNVNSPGALLVTTQPTGATISVQPLNGLDQIPVVLNSIQSEINTLFDANANNYPYSDVTVSGSFSSALFNFTFGALTPTAGNPSSGGRPQNLLFANSDLLQNGTTIVNLNIISTVTGAPSQGIGSATCTQNGPVNVPATFLSVIGSPVSGWASVSNPLDCIPGTNAETDTEALTRRSGLLASLANGPLQSIITKVSQLSGVVQTLGFENTSLAANQIVSFIGIPSAGSFTLAFTGPGGSLQTTAAIPYNALASNQIVMFNAPPTGGTFTLAIGAVNTGAISFSANAAIVQAAVRTIPGYSNTIVTGSFSLGFIFSFAEASQLPITVFNNSLTPSTTITIIPSVQSRINALTSYAQVLVSGTFPSNFEISFNGSAGGQPQLLAVAANSLTSVSAINVTFGRPGKSFEIVVNDNNGDTSNTLIATTILDSKPAGIQAYGTTLVSINDIYGNPFLIGFSRPTQIPIYVVIVLQTDITQSSTPQFNVSSITTIQQDIVTIGNAFKIGGTIIGFGTNGLIGAFNGVPGIINYTLYFGTSPNPTQNVNIQLQPEQVALFETFLVEVSYT